MSRKMTGGLLSAIAAMTLVSGDGFYRHETGDISKSERLETCPNCGNEFDRENSSKSYCSAKCFKEGRAK